MPQDHGYMSGFMGPVPDEIDAINLEVTGSLPIELNGRYFRNGANPLPGTDPGHNFTGQGMIHGIRLKDGRAEWYRNRWVRTPTMQGARSVRPDGTRDLTASVANTHIINHANQILALVETCVPYRMSPDLETLGPWDFGGRLKTPMTAHPKEDPATGDLHFFGYSAAPPFLTYHVVSAQGELVHSSEVAVTGPTMMHDFAITEKHVVWLDLPVVFDMALTRQPGMPFRWSDSYPARLGVMQRKGNERDVRWFDVKPGYAFHIGNAHEDSEGRIILEAVRYDRQSFNTIWRDLGGVSTLSDDLANYPTTGGNLYRWILDPVTNTVSEQTIDDLGIEFPTINSAHVGRGYRHVYAVNTPLLSERAGPKVVKYDLKSGSKQIHDLERGWIPGEAVFVPAKGATAEDHGWVISIITHQTEDKAQLLVLDADDLDGKAVASVKLPRRVPAGFHGSWIQDADA